MIKGGPKIINDGLVLCLDAHDAKSYAGEPTTNLAASAGYPNFSNWVAEGTAEKISAGYNFQDQPVYKCNTSVGIVHQGITRTISGLRTAASGGSVTVSVWVKNPNQTSYNFYAYIGHDFTSTRTLAADSDWQRIEWTVLESSMANDVIEYRPYTNTSGVYIHMTMPQVEVKTYATPWVDDSRSATNGWVDRTTNNNDGTLVNGVNTGVSHYRNGQVIMPVANSYLRFDGSNDKIQVDNIPQIFDGSVTMESWFFWDDDSRSIIFGNYDQGAGGHDVNFEKLGSRKLRIYWNRGERDVTTSADVVTTSGEWQHVVMVRDVSNDNFRFYVNGSLIQTTSDAGSNITSTGSTFRIGADTRDGTTVTNGGVGVLRLYSKALTAAEVLSNYNATKERF